MASISQTYKSKDVLKVEDLQGREYPLTISATRLREFDDGNKVELAFSETEKTFVCNITNANTIADLHGDDTDHWVGRQITVFPTDTDFNGRRVPCIRIRPRVQQLQQQTQMANAPIQQPAQQQVANSDHPFAPQQPAQNQTVDPVLNDRVPF